MFQWLQGYRNYRIELGEITGAAGSKQEWQRQALNALQGWLGNIFGNLNQELLDEIGQRVKAFNDVPLTIPDAVNQTIETFGASLWLSELRQCEREFGTAPLDSMR
jgi:hypothetical protein